MREASEDRRPPAAWSRALFVGRTAARALAVCGAIAMIAAGALEGQTTARSSTATDPRWTPWLGCWQSDTAGAGAAGVSLPVTCIIPVSGSSSVEALTIVGGQTVARRPLQANGKPHAIDESGCRGDETANWSLTGRRIYLRATYRCGDDLQAASSSIFAIAPNGDWLQVQNIRAGGGSLDRVMRSRPTSPPRGLPTNAASSLVAHRLAISTARAVLARPLETADVVEAAHSVDAEAVRSWILAAGQRFALDDAQLAALDRADVPPAIVAAMTGVNQIGSANLDAADQQSADDYLRGYSLGEEAYDGGVATAQNPYSSYNGDGSYVPYTPYPSYGYPGYGYGSYGYDTYGYGGVPVVGYPIAPPIVVIRGGQSGRPINHGHGPIGIPRTGQPPMLHPPMGRPIGIQPPSPRPPVTHMPVVHAPVSRSPAARAPSRTRP